VEAIFSSAIFGLFLCIGSFLAGKWIQKKTGLVAANPLLLAAVICVTVLLVFRIPYASFARGADLLALLLGPVTALLALGIYNQKAVLKRYFIPVLLGCTAGSMVSMGSILLLCRLFRVDQVITASLLPRSCTTAIALGISESHGGLAPVTVACVIIVGIVGAIGAPAFCRWFRITDPVAQGLAIGASSHALGTTKAREMGELQGAMSSLAIGICGLISVVLSLFVYL